MWWILTIIRVTKQCQLHCLLIIIADIIWIYFQLYFNNKRKNTCKPNVTCWGFDKLNIHLIYLLFIKSWLKDISQKSIFILIESPLCKLKTYYYILKICNFKSVLKESDINLLNIVQQAMFTLPMFIVMTPPQRSKFLLTNLAFFCCW